MMRRSLFLFVLICTQAMVQAQSLAPTGHVQDAAPVLVAFTNAMLHLDARTVVPKGTLVVRNGVVVAAGEKVQVPQGAMVRDLQGLHVWPALIEPYSGFGLAPDKPEDRRNEQRAAHHWNRALRAEAHAHELLRPDGKQAGELRRQGFALVLTHRMDG
ncbi:MAG TPA: hypothetical protein PLN54_15745, partial [Flavobacteriales bacterium]|nr:hypothetical protein [Flavobacteriales bacterium]